MLHTWLKISSSVFCLALSNANIETSLNQDTFTWRKKKMWSIWSFLLNYTKTRTNVCQWFMKSYFFFIWSWFAKPIGRYTVWFFFFNQTYLILNNFDFYSSKIFQHLHWKTRPQYRQKTSLYFNVISKS